MIAGSRGSRAAAMGFVALCIGLVAAPGTAQAAVCEADLGAQLEAIANRPLVQVARVGVVVETQGQTVSDRYRLYARDADQFFIPASNAKLLSTAAVLHRLGPDYRITTTVYGTLQPDAPTVLRLVGHGDPSLTQADLADLAQQLQAQGVRQVSQLVADDSYFPGSAVPSTWEWEDIQAGYGAAPTALIVDQNEIGLRLIPQAVGQPLAVTWDDPAQAARWTVVNTSRTTAAGSESYATVGRDLAQPILYVGGERARDAGADPFAVAVPNPTEQAAQQLQMALAQVGVSVGRTAVTHSPVAPTDPPLATVTSAPLGELLAVTNRTSNNLYAEALLRTLGVVTQERMGGNPATDATAAGITAATAALQDLGLNPDGFVMADASGLSRHNLVTPATLATLLQLMTTHPYGDTYRDSLAIAGVRGTLRYRLANTPLAGRVQGKTGAVTGNVSLTAYVDPPQYDPLVVSILINNSDQHASRLRALIDDMLLEIAQLRHCSP